MPTPKALVSWSSGKDCAWALHEVRRAGALEIAGLLTTVTSEFGRVSMHAVREQLTPSPRRGRCSPPRSRSREVRS